MLWKTKKKNCADHNREQNSDGSTVTILTELPRLDLLQSKNLRIFYMENVSKSIGVYLM